MGLVGKHKLIMTRRCDRVDCDDVIYRDTIDKDDAFVISVLPGLYFCSEGCIEQDLKKRLEKCKSR